MKEKIVQDSKQSVFPNWKSYFLVVVGMLLGIMLVSVFKSGEVNWTLTGKTFALSVLLFFSLWLMSKGIKRVGVK